jgi:hypothetical protein
MLCMVTVDGRNYDVCLNAAMEITGVYHHNTDQPLPAWQQRRGQFDAAISLLLNPAFHKAKAN